jgi:hypothetical protein
MLKAIAQGFRIGKIIEAKFNICPNVLRNFLQANIPVGSVKVSGLLKTYVYAFQLYALQGLPPPVVGGQSPLISTE